MRNNTQSKRLPAKISVIMPAFNEENTISQIVDKVLEQKIVKQLIIVDDHSSDATASIIRKKEILEFFYSSTVPTRERGLQ